MATRERSDGEKASSVRLCPCNDATEYQDSMFHWPRPLDDGKVGLDPVFCCDTSQLYMPVWIL
jgi:hypothetical protein